MSTCPELDRLFEALEAGEGEALEHAAHCPQCSAILEEHRQLEKDLYRLADPLPPSTFVAEIMAKVATQPVPHRVELKVGLSILASTFALAVASFILGHGRIGAVGSSFASNLVSGRAAAGALGNGLAALWHTAATPMALGLTFALFAVLVGLRRLSSHGMPDGTEVSG